METLLSLVPSFSFISLCYVSRNANNMAHELARFALILRHRDG